MEAESKTIWPPVYPHLKKGEFFLGNTSDKERIQELGIAGISLRQPAYDINGQELTLENEGVEYFALIAQNIPAYDAYNSAMEKHLSDIRKGLTRKD